MYLKKNFSKLKKLLLKVELFKYVFHSFKYFRNDEYNRVQDLIERENNKKPLRTDIINFLLEKKEFETNYLEIGVRNPDENYNKIIANKKYSVDPGVEYELNPVDFKTTSDEFFSQLASGEILSPDIRFDVIFIDGLHLADQVDRDIENSLKFLKDDGFIVMHDCNPPSEWHARENYNFIFTPADHTWNGTTWKAFLKWRQNSDVNSCCIDTDWGVGIISRHKKIGKSIEKVNPYFEYYDLEQNRKEYLNLVTFNEFKIALMN